MAGRHVRAHVHEEGVLFSSAPDGRDVQAYGLQQAGVHWVCRQLQEAFQVQLHPVPAACSAQPADGGYSSCRLGVLLQ